MKMSEASVKKLFQFPLHISTRTMLSLQQLFNNWSMHSAVWQWQRTFVKTVQHHCLVWIYVDT